MKITFVLKRATSDWCFDNCIHSDGTIIVYPIHSYVWLRAISVIDDDIQMSDGDITDSGARRFDHRYRYKTIYIYGFYSRSVVGQIRKTQKACSEIHPRAFFQSMGLSCCLFGAVFLSDGISQSTANCFWPSLRHLWSVCDGVSCYLRGATAEESADEQIMQWSISPVR